VPELDASVFVIPREHVKNGLDRYVVLNRVAKSVIDNCRGNHPERVFTRDGDPLTRMYNSGWKAARRRAAKRYQEVLNRPCPPGFRSLRVHDLKQTFGHRLRVAGIGFEDRKVLLGHKSSHVTTHYSAPEIGALIAASDRVCNLGSRKSSALSLVRAQMRSQVPD
jgi:integrase